MPSKQVVSTREWVAGDPECPPMRVFLDDKEVSGDTLKFLGAKRPGISVYGWVFKLTNPRMEVNGEALVETKYGQVLWLQKEIGDSEIFN